jgi:hypothetical protein
LYILYSQQKQGELLRLNPHTIHGRESRLLISNHSLSKYISSLKQKGVASKTASQI